MSGGRFNYTDRNLVREMFDWGVDANYGLGTHKEYKNNVRRVRKQNVFEDKVISEIIYDVMCLIHSYDWYASADTGEEDYLKDVKFFKKKWLKLMPESYVKELVDEEIENAKRELLKALIVEDNDE